MPDDAHAARLENRAGEEGCACGLASDGLAAHIYNEEAFRYFLEIERKRAEASKRPFVLLLVDLRKQPNGSAEIDPASADLLFASLSRCLRDTDFIGWYRAGSVVGAVLTQHADGISTDVQEIIGGRVDALLVGCLPRLLARRLQVRVYQLPTSIQGLA
jgi:hypothetical protein